MNSEKGANMLTEIVTTTILRNVGKKAGKGEQLVNEYNKRYKQWDRMNYWYFIYYWFNFKNLNP